MKRILIVSLFIASIAVPVFAAPLPDSLTIEYGKVFQNIFVNGDQLYICRYNLQYNATPDEDSNELFVFAICSGDVVLRDRALLPSGYGDDVIAIYLKGDDVLDWGGEYTMKIIGNPGMFSSPPFAAKYLDSASWVSGDMETSRSYIANAIINQTIILEGRLNQSLTVDTTEGIRLNSAGIAFWSEAIPGISAIPNLSYVSSTYPTTPDREYT